MNERLLLGSGHGVGAAGWREKTQGSRVGTGEVQGGGRPGRAGGEARLWWCPSLFSCAVSSLAVCTFPSRICPSSRVASASCLPRATTSATGSQSSPKRWCSQYSSSYG